MRSLRERLSNSERAVDALKSNMSSMVTQRDQVHSELHQARLQAAQLTLQLADCSLALREGRARWAQERQAMQRDTEVNSCSAAPHRTQSRRLWGGRTGGTHIARHVLVVCVLHRRTTSSWRSSPQTCREWRRSCRRRGWRE